MTSLKFLVALTLFSTLAEAKVICTAFCINKYPQLPFTELKESDVSTIIASGSSKIDAFLEMKAKCKNQYSIRGFNFTGEISNDIRVIDVSNGTNDHNSISTVTSLGREAINDLSCVEI